MIFILLLLLAGGGGFTYTAFISPTRKCKKCRGAKFSHHHGRFYIICPHCEGRGRQVRLTAALVHSANKSQR